MNSNQRLFVTPEERARRLSEQGGHPHGGEGSCGGREGHGTPELQRQKAAERESRVMGQGMPVRDARKQADATEKQNASAGKTKSAEQPAVKKADAETSDSGQGLAREQLVSAMKLSFVLGEPACRRYGMPAPFRRNG